MESDRPLLIRTQVGSHKKFSWVCSECGHSWSTELRVRTITGCGCPVCNANRSVSGKPQKPEPGESLQDVFPDVAAMWDFEKNGKLSPSDVKPQSEHHVWWTCDYGHSFQRSVGGQVRSSRKCPECAKGASSSFAEQFLYYACRQAFGENNVLNRDRNTFGVEIDILVQNPPIAIEYGSWTWHKDKIEFDVSKGELCRARGYDFYCIYDNVPSGDRKRVLENNGFICIDKPSMRKIEELTKYLGDIISSYPNAGFDEEYCTTSAVAAMNPTGSVAYENSLEYAYPKAVEEWDYERNFPLLPSQINRGSNHDCFFVCEHGHSYKTSPKRKTTRGAGCPVCSSEEIRPGVNSFQATQPKLVRYWDRDSNDEDPDEIAATSNKKKEWHWKCPECGYSWTTASSATLIKYERDEYCPWCQQAKKLDSVLPDIHFSKKGTSLFVDDVSLQAMGVIDILQHMDDLREYVRKILQDMIAGHDSAVTGNNKCWVVETDQLFIRINKGSNTIAQLYIVSSGLGEKTTLHKNGKATFSNVPCREQEKM